jgi:hypothetical protein
MILEAGWASRLRSRQASGEDNTRPHTLMDISGGKSTYPAFMKAMA